MRIVTKQRQRLLWNLELLEPEEVEELKPRLDELKVQRDTLMQQAGQLRERLQGRTADRDRLERLLQWARLEVERVDELSAEERHAILLELGVQVYVYPVGSPERFVVELGAKPAPVQFFADID